MPDISETETHKKIRFMGKKRFPEPENKTEADKDYRTDGVQQMRFGIEKQKENPEMNKECRAL